MLTTDWVGSMRSCLRRRVGKAVSVTRRVSSITTAFAGRECARRVRRERRAAEPAHRAAIQTAHRRHPYATPLRIVLQNEERAAVGVRHLDRKLNDQSQRLANIERRRKRLTNTHESGLDLGGFCTQFAIRARVRQRDRTLRRQKRQHMKGVVVEAARLAAMYRQRPDRCAAKKHRGAGDRIDTLSFCGKRKA